MSSEVKGIGEAVLQASELATRTRNTPPSTDSRSTNTSHSSPATDSVVLTATAGQLQALEKKLETVPVVDQQRVDVLRKSIADGSFQMDSTRVAEKLIKLESALIDHARDSDE